MINIVKITTVGKFLEMLCPHTCRGCGRAGTLLCDCCKNYNSLGKVSYCPICQRPEERGVCAECELPFEGVYMCGWRDELLGQMVEEYKYQSVRAMSETLAGLLDDVLPEMDGKVALVPLPTIRRHIRERGFDHIALVAQKLAKKRGWRVEALLQRAANTVQVGASAKRRREQASKAYRLCGKLDEETTYVLVDDVWTTGASMMAAEKILREAGASKIIAAVLVVSR